MPKATIQAKPVGKTDARLRSKYSHDGHAWAFEAAQRGVDSRLTIGPKKLKMGKFELLVRFNNKKERDEAIKVMAGWERDPDDRRV